MIKTYGVYATMFSITSEVAEFKNKEDAGKAKGYLQRKYGVRCKVIEEGIFESYDEFLKKEGEG